jgi:hypothetical protein
MRTFDELSGLILTVFWNLNFPKENFRKINKNKKHGKIVR